MFSHILLRFRRTPLPAVSVMVFAAVLAAVLCGLNAANETEQARFEEVYRTIPVSLTVTNLKGTRSDDLGIYSEYQESFLGSNYSVRGDLSEFVTDVRLKATVETKCIGTVSGRELVGTNALTLCRELWAENGGVVSWLEGWDEGCLSGEERVCLIPAGLDTDGDGQEDSGSLTVTFACYPEGEVSFDFTIVGTVRGSEKLYCPFFALDAAASDAGFSYELDAMRATLKDNSRLEAFRAAMGSWFIEPDPSGTQVPWKNGVREYYPYALDIDDSQLQAASETLENSLLVNRVCTLLVLLLSAGAGFFVGFLMIRSRKREITLMRTLGEANGRVYLSFALEQMLCVLLGTVLGGVYFLWQPAGQLALFVIVYFAGLSAALGVFLRSNLMSEMKEDE